MGRNGDGEGGREALDRRKFLRMGMLGTVATAGGFSLVGNVAARAAAEDLSSRIVPKRKVAPGLVQAGPELALPPGFSYKTLQPVRHGDVGRVPDAADARRDGCLPSGPNGTYKIVRNHELGEGNDIPAGTVIGIPDYAYDRKSPGGTTTLTVDSDGNLLDCFISMNGTNTQLLRDAHSVGDVALVRGNRRSGWASACTSRTATSSRWTRTPPDRRSTSR